MKRLMTWTLLVAMVWAPLRAAAQDPGSDTINPQLVQWLEAQAIALDSFELEGRTDDLEPLKPIFGEARIVALGGAAFGTHEFAKLQHRLVRLLVEELSFSAILFEAPWSTAEGLNTYLLIGEGNPAAEMLPWLPWTWNSQEMLDMIEWLRAYNVANPDSPVRIAGYDLEYPPAQSIAAVLAILELVDPEAAAIAAASYSCLPIDRAEIPAYQGLPFNETANCQAAVTAVYDRMLQLRHGYEAATSNETYERTLHHARLIVQAEDVLSGRSGVSAHSRYRAENIEWLLAHADPDKRFVLWSSNRDVAGTAELARGSTGQRLHALYPGEVVSVGFTFYEGGFHAVEIAFVGGEWQTGAVQVFEAPPALPGSVEHALHAADLPLFALNIQDADFMGEGARWFRSQRPLRMIDAVYAPEQAEAFFAMVSLPTMFDVLIHVDSVTPAELLPLPEEGPSR